MYEEIINKMADKKSVRKKNYKKRSLREKVLSLVVEANKNAPLERRVIPRSALTVMARAEKRLSALSGESKELGVLREVSNFITAHVDTFKAYEYSVNTDLLPVGHPKAISNLSASANTVREKYANWLSSDPMLDDSVRSLVASAHSLEPGTVERKHAFARLRVTRAGSTPTFFKIDSLTALVAAFSFSAGNSSAARRARVALQWRDRRGRWVEMGRGLDFNFRLSNGDIASAGGTYVGVNAARGYSTENGKPVANAGLVEVRGNPNIPDGIYSIESANATPVKARVPGEALRRAKIKAAPSVRKPTAEESQSKDIPNLDDLLKTRVDAPSGWEKQDDGSFLSDDNYKAIPSESGYSLHRLDKDGNTGDKVADASSWAEVQAAAEKDSDDYEKFKESVGVKDQDDEETRKGVEGARAAQKERLAESIFNRRTEGGESLEEVAEDLGMTREQVRKIESDYMRDNPEKAQALQQKPDEKFTYFDKSNPPRLSADKKNVEVDLLLDDAPKFYTGDPAGPSDLEEYGVPYITKEGMGDDDIYKVSISVPLDKMDDFMRDWNNTVNDSGPYARGPKDSPQEIFGDVYDNYKATPSAKATLVEEFDDSDTQLTPEQRDAFIRSMPDKAFEERDGLQFMRTDPIYAEMADEIEVYDEYDGAPDAGPQVPVATIFGDGSVEWRDNEAYNKYGESFKKAVGLDKQPGDGPDEPPAPPSPGGDTLSKVPSPSSPSTPDLFKEFDVPDGAFQLRTVDYEPDGRVDEESSDFTDDPSVIATKYPLAVIINAFTESLIGEKDDSVLSGILDSSIDDDEEPLDLEDVDNVVDTSVTPAGRANGTGAGSLEFNAGAEFVPAEALYNAVFLAGGDPNRVIANAYDAVNGNRNNLDRLHNAAGGVPNAEEAKLVDDIFQEIGQIKDASTPEEIEQKAASPIEGADEDKPLPGELIYNVPVNFDNPDYYDIDSNPYPPTLEEPDEFGFTDNPEYIARNFVEADLLEQFEIAITDGTGVINLVYNDEVPLTEGTYQVPAEAVRDALQLQGINTNDVLERIRDESNDFEDDDDEEAVTPQPEETATESSEASMDGAIDSMRNYYPLETLLRDIKPLMYLPADGSVAFKDAWDDLMIARPGGVIQPLNVTEDWLRDPNGAGQAGWRDLTDAEKRAILGTSESAPAEPTPEPQRFQYPGPKEPGYSPNNTTLVLGGTGGSAAERAVVGKGARVLATKDNKLGTVVAIQNDPEYVRIRFDDGTTAVRSATKVRAVSDGGGQVPQVVTREDSPPSQDVAERLNKPLLPAPRLARSGETLGVNDESSRPEILEGKTKEDAVQSDFSSWGTRDAEIAKAAVDRVSLDTLEQEAYKYHLAREKRDSVAEREALDSIKALLGDAYGDRQGISFGGEFFSMRVKNVTPVVFRGSAFTPATEADINNGKASTIFEISLDVLDVSGNVIGRASRSVGVRRNLDRDNNLINTSKTATAQYLVISNGEKKQKGFGSAYNRWVENWYIANGVEKVKVSAAGGGAYQGGFVWALNGYNWQDADDADSILRQLQRKVSNSLEESQVEYLSTRLKAAKRPDGSYDMGLVPTPIEFALVGWDPEKNPEKDTWIGKQIMVQNSWNGVKNLTPSAREQVQAVNYNQIRSARGRVLSKQNMPNVSSEGLTAIESNEFRNSPTIAPYYSQIRDALRNNRSLAVLSPDAKNALNDYVSQQMLLSGSKASLPLEDAFQLRSGLINEYRADYGYSDPFNSAEVLSTFKVDDFSEASTKPDKAKLTEAGFKVRSLQDAERGVNATFEVTHVASGQVFYVKNDTYVTDYSSTLAGVTELESSIILRAAGMQGIHEVRVGKNDENLVIMSRAGSSIPLQDEAVNAYVAFRRGIKNTKGINTIFSPQDFINDLDNPEDLVRMSILDILGSNEDRHNGNWMIAFDKGTGKLRIFPVDNTIGELRTDNDSIADYINNDSLMEADVYNDYMPALVNSVGSVGMLKMYENEIDNIVKNLDNPLYQPKGFEMDKIIQKWGSYDAFKDVMSARLKKLVTKDTQEYNALKNVLRVGYWN